MLAFFSAHPAAPLPPLLQSLTWDRGVLGAVGWFYWLLQHAPASVPMSLQCCGLWAGEHLGVLG